MSSVVPQSIFMSYIFMLSVVPQSISSWDIYIHVYISSCPCIYVLFVVITHQMWS